MTKYLRKREADIIWRVRHGPGEGDWFYDVDTLDRWFYRILDAAVLEDVFEDAK